MSKQATPKQLIRIFNGPLLFDFLEQNGVSCTIEDEKKPSIEEILEWISSEDEEDIFAVLRDAYDFKESPTGIQAILDEAAFHGKSESIKESLDKLTHTQEKVLWTLLHEQDIFHKALSFAYSDKLSQRSWKKWPGFPRKSPVDFGEKLENLGKRVSSFFNQSEGRGGHFHVDVLDRHGTIYYFISLSDYPKHSTTFDGPNKQFSRTARTDSFDVIFRFNPEVGSLDVYAQNASKKVKTLTGIFAEECLSIIELPEIPKKAVYNLEPLKNRSHLLPVKPQDGFSSSRVKAMRFFLPTGEKVDIEVKSKDYADDARGVMDTMSFKSLSGEYIDLKEAILHWVEIQLEMETTGGKPKPFKFTLTSPDKCNLKERPEDEIVRRYLVDWGLAKEDVL
jgi:hypothetical protein